ncbi:MAG: amino acid permease [Methanobacteriota archaeon]|nr:MAG: amino acid permease [Euryarchaeota archaeon]
MLAPPGPRSTAASWPSAPLNRRTIGTRFVVGCRIRFAACLKLRADLPARETQRPGACPGSGNQTEHVRCDEPRRRIDHRRRCVRRDRDRGEARRSGLPRRLGPRGCDGHDDRPLFCLLRHDAAEGRRPVAFTQYFLSLVPGIDELGKALLKGVFIAIILSTNLVGVKTAGRVNDALTIAKLTPLLLIVVGGIAFLGLQPGTFASNLSPFVTGDLSAFGRALVLIFWAYAGFELSTLPTDEIDRPGKTIPRAIVIGMLIVIAFYLFTNFVVMGAVGGGALGVSTSPLIDAAHAMFSAPILLTNAVVIVVGLGALLSITGADESGTVGTSRLAYAMSIDGLLPETFSRSHSRFKTPYLGLIVLCLTAYVASLLGGLTDLISSAVFLLAFVYFMTCISTILLERKHPKVSRGLRGKRLIPVVGAFFSLVLMGLVNPLLIGISLILLAVGVPVYVFFSPRHELQDLKAAFWSAEAISRRAYSQGGRFLAYPLRRIQQFTRREP